MKASEYNYIIERDEFSYWYNGVTHKYFRLPKSLGTKLEKALAMPETLRLVAPTLYNKFFENGFLIEDEVDELEVIKGKNHNEIYKKDYYLTVLPTLNCNFKCWYCIQDHVPSIMGDATIEKVKKHILYMIEEEKITSLNLEWFGGEPFMFFDQVIVPIGSYAKSLCEEHNIPFSQTATTNGFFLQNKNLHKIDELGFSRFQITFDGVKEKHDKVKFQNGCDSAFDAVLANIDSLLSYSSSAWILLRVNYTADNLSEEIVHQISERISKENRKRVSVMFRRVWQEGKNESNYDRIRKIQSQFIQEGFLVNSLHLCTDFVPCYVNRKYYNSINWNGDIVKCTAGPDLYRKERAAYIDDSGKIVWVDENYPERVIAKSFENERCLECKFLPICMGHCPRNHMQGAAGCKLNSNDSTVEDEIVDLIDFTFDMAEIDK